MSRAVVLGALLGLLGVGWWVVADGDPGEPPVALPASSEAQPAVAQRAEPAGPAASVPPAEPAALATPAAAGAPPDVDAAAEPAAPAYDAVPETRLAGRVISADGAPLPGAEVRLLEHAHRSGAGWRFVPVARVLADDAGAFAFDGLPERFRVDARHAGWACVQRVKGDGSVGLDVQGAEIVMQPALEVTGRVTTADGVPVADARLVLRELAGSPVVVAGLAGQRLPDEPRRELALGVSPTGPASAEARSDAPGAFRFEPQAPGERALTVSHDEHTTLRRDVQLDGTPLEIALDGGASLLGLVYGADGEPLPGVEVFLRDAGRGLGGGGTESREAVTDEHGAFHLRGLSPSTSAFLKLRAEGHAVHVAEGITIPESGREVLELSLEPERVIAGVIRDPDGAPVPDIELHVQGERVIDFGMIRHHPVPTWEQRLERSRTTTDAEGRFRFGQLYAGAFELRASRDGDPVDTWTVRGGDDELELTVDVAALGSVEVRGVVTDADDGEPLRHFEVYVWRPSSSGRMSGRSHSFEDAGGRFSIAGLNPGTVRIEAQADGYHDDGTETLELGPGTHEFAFALTPHRELHLRVIRPDGAPVEGAIAAFEHADPAKQSQMIMVPVGGGSRSSAIQTDADGELVARELPAERLLVKLHAEWGHEPQVLEYDLGSPLPGVQTVILDEALTSQPTEREVSLMLMAVTEERPDDVVGTSQEDFAHLQEPLKAAYLAGVAVPLARAVELRFDPADGGPSTRGSYGKGDDGQWTCTYPGGFTYSPGPGAFSMKVPVGAGTLALDIEGKGTRVIPLPPGSEEVHAALFFDAP